MIQYAVVSVEKLKSQWILGSPLARAFGTLSGDDSNR